MNNLSYSPLSKDYSELKPVGQVQLVQNGFAGGNVAGFATNCAAPESLCYQQVIPVNIQNLAGSLVGSIACEMFTTHRTGKPDLPKVVWHPHKKPVIEKSLWSGDLVINQCWLWWIIPEFEVRAQPLVLPQSC